MSKLKWLLIPLMLTVTCVALGLLWIMAGTDYVGRVNEAVPQYQPIDHGCVSSIYCTLEEGTLDWECVGWDRDNKIPRFYTTEQSREKRSDPCKPTYNMPRTE